MRVIVTGAGGFVDQQLCSALEESGLDIVPVFRALQQERGKSSRMAVFGKSLMQ